jgi:hypothetical protein
MGPLVNYALYLPRGSVSILGPWGYRDCDYRTIGIIIYISGYWDYHTGLLGSSFISLGIGIMILGLLSGPLLYKLLKTIWTIWLSFALYRVHLPAHHTGI